jgi:hypothetical protein
MRIVLCLVAVLVGVVVIWLAMGQRQLRHEVHDLRAQNEALKTQMAQRPGISATDLVEAEWRLQQTWATIAAAEARLTNLLSQVSASDPTGIPPGSSGRPQIGTLVDLDLLTQPNPGPRPPASSHSPNGELLNRNWGPEQVVGAPNTDRGGDIVTAWASAQPDGGVEWLHVNYDQPVDIAEVRIRETYNPGAISKITAMLPNGREVTIWEGEEPQAEAPVDTSFAGTTRVQANSVKVYMDTRRVPGWNEIDAIELIGRDGTRQWAKSATASSTYAER